MSTLYAAPADPPSTAQAAPSAAGQSKHRPSPPGPGRHRNAADSHRRQVAILFADISGFTRLTETVDPEIVYQRVSPLLDDLVVHVHQHRGEIQQVLGDGFMAAFGLHSTQGDEAEQAVRAGEAMLAGGGNEPAHLDVHLGIECGEVLVTRRREPASFGVWGHAVNVARRLCEAAAPAQLVVGPAAFTRSRREVDSPAAVLLQLHGITRPVIAYRIGRR
jgi:class 3 adenylate cyclase